MIGLLSELSARHLAKGPIRSAVAVLGGALGIALYLAHASASARTRAEFEGLVQRSFSRADLSVEAPGIGLLRDSVESVVQIPGVAHASARVEIPVQVTDVGESLLLVGIDPPSDVAAGEERNAVFLSERFASKHGLAPGSPIHLQSVTGPREFTIRGVLPDSGPAAAFDGQFAAMFLDSLQAEFGRGHFVDRIDVALAPGADTDAVERSLHEVLGNEVSVGAAERRGAWLRELFEPVHRTWQLAGGLALVAVLTAIGGVLLGGTKPSEGAPPSARRAIDRTPVPVLRMAAAGAALALAAWLPVLRGEPWRAAVAFGCTVTGAALLTPGLVVVLSRRSERAARILGVPRRFGRAGAWRSLSRATLLLCALFAAAGASARVAASLSSFERATIRWAESSGLEDLTVTRGSPLFEQRQVVYAGSVADAVARIEGVAGVQRYRRLEQRVDERTITLVATDTDAFIDQSAQRGKSWPLLRGAPLKRGELESGPEILLGAGAAKRLAKDTGDSVIVHAPRGDIPFVVRGIIDGDPASTSGFIDRRHLRAYWVDDTVDRIAVYVAPGHPAESVAGAIRATLGTDGPSFVTATAKLRGRLVDSLRPVLEEARWQQRNTFGLALLAAVIALVGLCASRPAPRPVDGGSTSEPSAAPSGLGDEKGSILEPPSAEQ